MFSSTYSDEKAEMNFSEYDKNGCCWEMKNGKLWKHPILTVKISWTDVWDTSGVKANLLSHVKKSISF